MKDSGKQQYSQILRSSLLIGSSSALEVGLRICRTKAMALILGPSGVGLFGIYGSISDLVLSVSGMGINSSGVRQIAMAVGTGDTSRISRVIKTLRIVAPFFGLLGALFLFLFSKPIARLSFGDDQHSVAISFLGLVVLLGGISAGQVALVQGMRRIGDLAKISVLGALYGTVFSIPIVYYWGELGVVPSLVCVSTMAIVTSWWYARKIRIEAQKVEFKDIISESRLLLQLGSVFMASDFVTMAAGYANRLVVLRLSGVESAGYYQAAWALGGLYVGFILNAMAADYYPSLTAVANDHEKANNLVNKQVEVGLLLATPGILGTLTFAQIIIYLAYSSKFDPAIGILRWICFGMLLRISSWPLGYILRAKGAVSPIFWTEVAKNASLVLLAWVCVLYFGLSGTGIAFCISYVIYWTIVYALARSLTEFRWSASNKQLGLIHGTLMTVVFMSWNYLPRVPFVVLGSIITLFVCAQSLRRLHQLEALGWLPAPILRLLPWIGLSNKKV